ncbi:MAG: c-type cytochrome biogenesis protein CcsB [Deltaproteobacteria bacterium]|nr:c-type cytochrome biogenesis protein CcsB [Deltaproteobacteria bacterium]
MGDFFFYITAIAYALSTLVYIAYLFARKDGVIRYAEGILIGGFALHTAALIVRWAEAGRAPVATLHEALTFFSWITAALYLAVLFKYRLRVLGVFVAPFALVLLVTASFLPRQALSLPPALASYWLPAHVIVAFLGNAFFAIAFFLGVMYVIQDHYLKSRKLRGIYFIMPSLEIIDELNYKCLQYGFPLLTLAIISGAIWSETSFGSYWDWRPRQIWSLITWFLYAALLHGRLTAGWRGRKAAIFSGVAFAALVGSFIVINLVSGGAHGLLR